jgi:alpha/beta superfamily hydrolase
MAALCAGVLGFAATTIGHYAEAWVCGYFFSALVAIFMLMAFASEG